MVFVSAFRRKSLASASTACATCALQGRRLSAANSQCQHNNDVSRCVSSFSDESSEDDTAGYRPPSSLFSRSSISLARRPSVPEALLMQASHAGSRKQYSSSTTNSPFSTITAASSSTASPRRPSLFQSWRTGRRRSSAQPQQQPVPPSSPSSSRNTARNGAGRDGNDACMYLSTGSHLGVAGPSSPSSSSSSSTRSATRVGAAISPRIADTWIYSPHQWRPDGQKGTYEPPLGLDDELQRLSPSSLRARNDNDEDAKSVISMSLTEEIALYLPKNQATPSASRPSSETFSWTLPVWDTPSTQYPDEQQRVAQHLGMMQTNESGFIDPHFRPASDVHYPDQEVQWNIPQWSEFAIDPFPTPRPTPRSNLFYSETSSSARHLDETWRDAAEHMLTPRLIGGAEQHLRRSPSSDSRRSGQSSPSLYSPTSALPPTPGGTQLHFDDPAPLGDRRDSADTLHKQFCSVLLLDLGNGTTVSMSPSPSVQPQNNPLLAYAF